MEGEEFCDTEEKLAEPEGEEAQEAQEAEVSVNAMLVHDKAPSTVRIVRWDKWHKLLILIDNGSTHSFVDPKVAKETSAPIKELKRPMMVKMANGVCRPFAWKMQNEEFEFDMGLLEVGGCDVILGMD